MKGARSKSKSQLYREGEDYLIERGIHKCEKDETPEQMFSRLKEQYGAKWVEIHSNQKTPIVKVVGYVEFN